MSKVSKSPERHSFQKEGYVKRQEKRGEPVNEDYLDWFEKIQEQHDHKFDDPKSHVNNMEYDLLTTDWILAKVRESDTYAQNLYAAMCNNDFQKLEVMPILKEEVWHCSWRYAGGIIADMQEKGDYIDWYCSGIGNDDTGYGLDHRRANGYVPEAVVTDEIREDLKQLKWIVVDWKNDE
jgi:hypothetical protein